MSYQIVRAETRLARMVLWMAGIQKRITDFLPGGKTRTKFEAISVELEAMDLQFYQSTKKAIPTSLYTTFKFPLLDAVRASGTVTFTASPVAANDISIPKGTRVAVPGTASSAEIIYETTAGVVLPAGQATIDAFVSAIATGPSGNTGAGTITALKTTISGLTSVTNAVAVSNGKLKEEEYERALRFESFISTLTRGTSTALEYGAKTASLLDGDGQITERVVDAKEVGPPAVGSAGMTTVYIFNGSDGASANLVTNAQNIIDGFQDELGARVPGYKAAGIVATVVAATPVAQNVVCEITATTGTDKVALVATAEALILTYMSEFGFGDEFVRNELVERIMNLDGVYDVDITTPAANVTVATGQVMVAGTITVTAP